MKSIPFFIDGVHGGFMKVEGIIRYENDGLYLEYQTKDALVEAYQSSIKTVHLPLEAISYAEFKMGWFRTRLFIYADSGKTLEAIPGKELTMRMFSFKKKHRLHAANLVSKLNLELSEFKLKKLDESES